MPGAAHAVSVHMFVCMCDISSKKSTEAVTSTTELLVKVDIDMNVELYFTDP